MGGSAAAWGVAEQVAGAQMVRLEGPLAPLAAKWAQFQWGRQNLGRAGTEAQNSVGDARSQ